MAQSVLRHETDWGQLLPITDIPMGQLIRKNAGRIARSTARSVSLGSSGERQLHNPEVRLLQLATLQVDA